MRRMRPGGSRPVAVLVLVALACAALGASSRAHAQSWSAARSRPPLFEIMSLDASGEPIWPYGQEDIAGDGVERFGDPEAQLDLRSSYAAPDADRLWIRSYVAGEARPPRTAVMFYFFDTDLDTRTGGSASSEEVWPQFEADPTDGGYERVAAVRGDASVLGFFRWDPSSRKFMSEPPAPGVIAAEFGTDRDPIGFGGRDHGYAQVAIPHTISGLTSSCRARIFIRIWNDVPLQAYGDDDPAPAACVPDTNAYGDPSVLRSDRCDVDGDCPANGRCEQHVCVFAYACDSAAECREGDRCEGNVCVRTSTARCTDDSVCNGLVCGDDDTCVACTGSGARACAAGLICTPRGTCIEPRRAPIDTDSDNGGVRGGAFRCSAAPAAGSTETAIPLALLLVFAALFALRRSRGARLRARSASAGSARVPRPFAPPTQRTARVRPQRRGFGSVLVLLLLVTAASSARAQSDAVDTQRFKPAATTGGYFQTEGSHVRYPVDPFSLGVWLAYAHNPLIATDPSGDVAEHIIRAQLGLDVTASYAFASFFELGLHMPVAYLGGDDVSEAALGDLRALPKFRILNGDRGAIGLAFIPELRAPTHTSRWYGGERFPAFAPKLVLDHRLAQTGLRLGIELGVLLQKATRVREVRAGSEFQAGLGLGYRFDRGRSPVELMLDMRAALGLTETDVEEVGLEGLAGVAIDLSPSWKLHAGAGLGLLQGFGVPTGRVFLGLRYEPSDDDPDHDGLRSPDRRERSGFDEAQPDDRQRSSPEPEQVAANLDAVDDADRARAIREGYDACPDLPEDYDGDEDEDGCPEGDRDGDGVLDYLDRCPERAETINGFEDDDGCEDEGPAKIVVEEGRLAILETIRFEPNSSRIQSDSYPILDQVVLTLRKYRQFDAIEIAGHTDSTGPRDLNMRLSRDRTRSVRQYLVAHGIRPGRLRATGYGPDHPIADNGTEDGRAKNRRVEFLIHGRSGD